MRSRWKIFTYVNLVITMVIGGLWHGASWNFVIWGALHGVGLAVVRLWQSGRGNARRPPAFWRYVNIFADVPFRHASPGFFSAPPNFETRCVDSFSASVR